MKLLSLSVCVSRNTIAILDTRPMEISWGERLGGTLRNHCPIGLNIISITHMLMSVVYIHCPAKKVVVWI